MLNGWQRRASSAHSPRRTGSCQRARRKRARHGHTSERGKKGRASSKTSPCFHGVFSIRAGKNAHRDRRRAEILRVRDRGAQTRREKRLPTSVARSSGRNKLDVPDETRTLVCPLLPSASPTSADFQWHRVRTPGARCRPSPAHAPDLFDILTRRSPQKSRNLLSA